MAASNVLVALPTERDTGPILTLLPAVVGAKLVPVIERAVKHHARVGVIADIEGAPSGGMTVKDVRLVIVPFTLVTEIVPEVAPAGTVAVREELVAAVTVAVVPLNFTVFCAGVAT